MTSQKEMLRKGPHLALPSVGTRAATNGIAVYKMVPPMLETFHKGQLGRVGVFGGSEDYTGAPTFSAMASAKLGCDMVGHASASAALGMLTIQ